MPVMDSRWRLLLMMTLGSVLPPQRAGASSNAASAHEPTMLRSVPRWATKWQLRPADGGMFEDLAASPELIMAAQPRAMRSLEAARLVSGGNFTPDALVGWASKNQPGDAVWHRTRRSNGRFFANANPGNRRWPDRRGAGSVLSAERAVDSTPEEFFATPHNTSEFRYYTCPLQRLAPQLFDDGVVDQRKFGLSEVSGQQPALEYNGGPLFRLASGGSVCQCHWDSKHNIFVQLHGSKRFYLWPTTALPALRLYSSKHALYPKSMINFDMVDETSDNSSLARQRFQLEGASELASLATAVVVDLEPGDVLYLPPMVPHHVECLGEPGTTVAIGPAGGWCVGFNVFSTGQFSRTLGAIQQQVHEDPLGWFDGADAGGGHWPQHPEFVLPMLQYVLLRI